MSGLSSCGSGFSTGDCTGEIFDIVADGGAIGDGTTDNILIINAAIADGKAVYIPYSDGGFYVSTAITVTDAITDMIISGPGTIIHPNTTNAILFDPTWGTEYSITAQTISTINTDDLVTRLTLGTGEVTASGIVAGDVCKAYSGDAYPYVAIMASDEKNYLGEEFAVLSIDAASDYVYVAGKLHDTFTTTPKIRKLPTNRCEIKGPRFRASGNVESAAITTRKDCILIYGCIDPQIDVFIESSWRAGVGLRSCFGGVVRYSTDYLVNNPTANAYGYGGYAYGSTAYTEWYANGRRCRHVWTGDISKETAYSAANYKEIGVPMHNRVEGVASEGVGADWDTHEGCRFTHFADIKSSNARRGGTGTITGKGIQDRGESSTFGTIEIVGATEGVNFASRTCTYDRYSHTTIGTITVRDCDSSAIDIESIGTTPPAPYNASFLSVGAFLAGVTTITFDAASVTGTILAGATFHIAGATKEYIITANNTAAANTFTGVTFSPPLEADIADNAALKVFPQMSRITIGTAIIQNCGKTAASKRPAFRIRQHSSLDVGRAFVEDVYALAELENNATFINQLNINGGSLKRFGTVTTDEPIILRAGSTATIDNFHVDYSQSISTRDFVRAKTAGESVMNCSNLKVTPNGASVPPSLFCSATTGVSLICNLSNVFPPAALTDNVTGGTITVNNKGYLQTKQSMSADKGNASYTINAGSSDGVQYHATTLTADRTATVNKFVTTTDGSTPWEGAVFRFVRPATGAFNLIVVNGAAGSTIFNLAAGEWGEICFDGTDWIKTAKGTL